MSGVRQKVMQLRGALYRALMGTMGALLPVDKNKVVFVSFGGHAYSDNPRAVCEALLQLRPNAKPIWLFKDTKKTREEMPSTVKSIRINSWASLYHYATASCWVLNGLMPGFCIKKRKNQFYVQTWHGDRMFKVCLHNSGKHGLPDVKVMDVGIIGSDMGEMFFRTAFQYEGELMRVGSPRNDAIMHIDANESKRIREKIGVREGERVAMYAPTMREHLNHTNQRQDLSNLDFQRVLDLLEKKYDCPWRLIMRAHSTVAGLTGIASDERIIDLSAYEDMRDLLMVTDLYMTDYSSSACDVPLKNCPVVLFQPDIEEYKEKDRALYFEMEDSPFWAASDQAQFEQFLTDMDEQNIIENSRAILDFFGTDESGEASMLVATRMIEHMDGLKRGGR